MPNYKPKRSAGPFRQKAFEYFCVKEEIHLSHLHRNECLPHTLFLGVPFGLP